MYDFSNETTMKWERMQVLSNVAQDVMGKHESTCRAHRGLPVGFLLLRYSV